MDDESSRIAKPHWVRANKARTQLEYCDYGNLGCTHTTDHLLIVRVGSDLHACENCRQRMIVSARTAISRSKHPRFSKRFAT
jgi:hypothetical protein